MDHEQASDLFSDYAEAALPEVKKLELERHLASCAQCRTDLESFRRTLGALGRLRQSAPPSLLEGIQHQIYTRSRGRFFSRRWMLFGRVPFEWLSLVMILLMLVYYLYALQSSPTGVSPQP